MLFSLLSGWNNPPPKAIDDSDNQSENMNPNTFQKSRPSVEKPLLKPGVHPIVSEQLKLSVDLFRGRLKHRDAAILIMRFLIKSDVRLSEPSSSFSCQDYLQFLDKLELLDLNTASFGAKHVLSVEGLEFSGKSTLINNIHKRVSKVKVINRQELPDVIHNHSETARIAWEFLENYRIAMEIIDGDDDVVLVEDYFHHFLTKYLRKFAEQEEDVNNVPYPSFAWPFDLPMPELVLFLTTTTDTRIERKRDEELSSGPTTIVPGATIMSEPVQDAIANAIFAAIRGPSTVGIDTSPAPMSVYATVLEALEYFGFYCISRNVTHAVSADGEVSRRQSTEVSAPVPSHSVGAAADDDYSFLVGQDEPMLPPDVITNRRISMGRVSMGVYGMYSKF